MASGCKNCFRTRDIFSGVFNCRENVVQILFVPSWRNVFIPYSPASTLLYCVQTQVDPLSVAQHIASLPINTSSLRMADSKSSAELALQICFGAFGILGVFIALAGIHYRDSVGCVFFRRRKRPRSQGMSSADAIVTLSQVADSVQIRT